MRPIAAVLRTAGRLGTTHQAVIGTASLADRENCSIVAIVPTRLAVRADESGVWRLHNVPAWGMFHYRHTPPVPPEEAMNPVPIRATLVEWLSIVGLGMLVLAPMQCAACDGCTWYAWQRTWHAYNALDAPLRDYFIPRCPGNCDYDVCSGEGVIAASCCRPGHDFDRRRFGQDQCGCGSLPGVCLETPGFERLGQIPNDFDLGGGVSSPGTSRAAR